MFMPYLRQDTLDLQFTCNTRVKTSILFSFSHGTNMALLEGSDLNERIESFIRDLKQGYVIH